MDNKKFAIKDNYFEELKEWGSTLTKYASQKPDALSLSYRYARGFVVTRQGADPGNLQPSDLLFVESWDYTAHESPIHGVGVLPVIGKMHAVVFKNRSGAIFSIFIRPDQKKFKAKCPEAIQLDSASNLTESIEKGVGKGNLFLLPEQEVILSIGCTANDAGTPILRALGRIR